MLGRIELYPGAEVASSVSDPMPTAWWLRPVSSAWRVGEHSAVVWNRLSFQAARGQPLSGRGVDRTAERRGGAEPDVVQQNTTSTLGAPAGGRKGSIGGNLVAGSLAS